MAKILISGYYGFDNTGDDTVLFGIISSLKKQHPDAEITVLSNKPDETASLFGIKSYNRWKVSEIIKQIKECQLLVMGGGSLLQDATSPRSVIYYLGIILLAKLFRKSVAFYGQGVGPISHPLSKWLIKQVVNRIDVITVRDAQSGEDFRSFGVNQVPIYVTADPAVTINPNEIDLSIGKSILEQHQIDAADQILAISVRDWKNQQKYKKEVARFADNMGEKGWKIVFIPMQYPSDVEPSKKIASFMKHPSVIIEEKLNFKEIMSMIGNVDMVLGLRLHAVILSAVMNTPFISISYDPKIDRFVQRLGLKTAGHIESLTYEDLMKSMHYIQKDVAAFKQLVQIKMKGLVEEAEKSSVLALSCLPDN
ncbi:polysaccharide pyruvyl transferase CsaB [Microaerobacter geothermalis]|uniref:polysaccharide pyruvyl transferase CsaB n=1 Tax=Microaerobacter geothermalis TaxID=674972 RepID=UPI001F29BC91|nr:polysaccharide pyruvyl transferase CsaB [Microaerobacter geothermalis]MCF6092590.1 polysaccharide pyruvyl transferase CsaB [Microaerobacter geothermalis]